MLIGKPLGRLRKIWDDKNSNTNHREKYITMRGGWNWLVIASNGGL
jgi:hypothetical protein